LTAVGDMRGPATLTAGDLLKDGTNLIETLARAGITARLIGGGAIAVRCPSVLPPSALARTYSDFDIVVSRQGARKLGDELPEIGFRGVDRFNVMNGQTRQLYRRADGIELDVFVGKFKMCHELDLRSRLEIHELTIPLADLLLTKLQVAKLTGKDVSDVTALMLDHDLTEKDEGISLARLREITATDWGWWKTVTDNLGKALQHRHELGLSPDDLERAERIGQALLAELQSAPKSLRWKARAAVGERAQWYEEPDEKR
jgi:hypothetical protein